MKTTDVALRRSKLIPEMEGFSARWYARLRGSGPQLEVQRLEAGRQIDGLRSGADVLEVAPGPGYLAIEIARQADVHVTTLDISRSFVQIATENAARAGVTIDVRHGDVCRMPFEADSFDLIVCQAAFKNFVEPMKALNEMHRVLRRGGTAAIQDLRKDSTGADIDEEVRRMQVSRLNATMTRQTLRMLRRRAYTRTQFERLAAESAFRGCVIHSEGIGMQMRLTKREAA
jgi:ubiquinone/menaquinone biosynthesis C-methylase UbiE